MPIVHRCARPFVTALAAVILCLASCLLVTGCSQQLIPQPAAEEEDAGPTSRSFMTEMNASADELQEKMTAFTDAVAREDLVSMRVQADAAFAVVDHMATLDAPDELKELQQKYVDGATQLKDVLNGYMDLYSEIDAATTRNPFDYDTYPERIASLQASYDAAVQALQDADESAAAM